MFRLPYRLSKCCVMYLMEIDKSKTKKKTSKKKKTMYNLIFM